MKSYIVYLSLKNDLILLNEKSFFYDLNIYYNNDNKPIIKLRKG